MTAGPLCVMGSGHGDFVLRHHQHRCPDPNPNPNPNPNPAQMITHMAADVREYTTHLTNQGNFRPRQSTRLDKSHQNREWRRAPAGGERHAVTTQRRGGVTSPSSVENMVRILHHIIKGTHHLNNVSHRDPAVTIAEKTRTLCSFIKPSNPSGKTVDNYEQRKELGILTGVESKRPLSVGHQNRNTGVTV